MQDPREYLKEQAKEETSERTASPVVKRKAWMRNKKCPCGSGKKFKKCHWTDKGMVNVLTIERMLGTNYVL